MPNTENSTINSTINNITAIILAGGKGTRMGNRNKGLLTINNETFIAHLLSKLPSQSKTQIISANNDVEEYQQYHKIVVKDQTDNYQGPLSGIISCKAAITTSLVLTIPCDSPMIPDDLSARLLTSYNKSPTHKLCVAHDGERLQNLFMLFDVTLLDDMQQYFQNSQRSVYGWINRHPFESVDFSDKAQNFINVNNEANLSQLVNNCATLLPKQTSKQT